MFKMRSKILFISVLLATLYTIYLVIYFTGAITGAKESTEAIGAGIATALVTPHMFIMGLGMIFGWLGFGLKAVWGALTGAILYAVSAILFIPYIILCFPIIILGFVGFAMQKKINNKELQKEG